MTITGISGLVVAVSEGSALFFAVSTVLKHVSAGRGPEAPTHRAGSVGRFVMGTVRHPLWLLGMLADGLGVALQVIALHLGALAVVQPLMMSGLVFAIVLRGLVNRRMHVREVVWVAVVAASLGGFLALSSSSSTGSPTAVDRIPAAICVVVGLGVVSIAIWVGAKSRRLTARAVLMGLAAGTIYAATAALLKVVSDIGTRSLLALLGSWQLYGLLMLGGVGLIVTQIVFRSGPLAAGLPMASAIDPLLSIIIGVSVFDEHVLLGPGHGVVLVVLLAVLGTAVVRLALLAERNGIGEGELASAGPEPDRAVVKV